VRGLSELEVLSRTAAALSPRTARGMALPNLLFFTDPARIARPEAVAERLPRGAGVVFRAFDAPDAVEQGLRLRGVADARGLLLLVGADPDLAEAVNADGLHMPERLAERLPALRSEHPNWLITTATHDREALRSAERAGADAAVVSPVFASRSPSAGVPLGVEGLRDLIAETDLPVYALGGVRSHTAPLLSGSGIVGIAAVEGLAT